MILYASANVLCELGGLVEVSRFLEEKLDVAARD